MKSENPCKNCLVKSICVTSCDELNSFAKEALSSEVMTTIWHNCWLEKYEYRPRIIELNKEL